MFGLISKTGVDKSGKEFDSDEDDDLKEMNGKEEDEDDGIYFDSSRNFF